MTYALSHTASGAVIFAPRVRRTGHGMVLCHGAGGSASGFSTAFPNGDVGAMGPFQLAAWLASNGVPCVSTDLGGTYTWGKDSVVQTAGDVDTAFAALVSAVGVDASKAHLLGISMGSLTTLRYMATQPAKVRSATIILPLVNMTDFYGQNRGGFQTSVAAAWSVTAPAALPNRADPSLNISAIAGSGPLLGYYSTADTLMTPSYEAPFAASINAAGGSASMSVCDSTHGHSDLSVQTVPFADVLSFVLRHDS